MGNKNLPTTLKAYEVLQKGGVITLSFKVLDETVKLEIGLTSCGDLVHELGMNIDHASLIFREYVEVRVGMSGVWYARTYIACLWLREILIDKDSPRLRKVVVARSFLKKLTIAYCDLFLKKAKLKDRAFSTDSVEIYNALHAIGKLERNIGESKYEIVPGTVAEGIVLAHPSCLIGKVEV